MILKSIHASTGSQLSDLRVGLICSNILTPAMSLAAAFWEALSGASLYLGIPVRVALPYSSLGRTSAWTADLKSSGGRKGLVFLNLVGWYFAPFVAALMCF